MSDGAPTRSTTTARRRAARVAVLALVPLAVMVLMPSTAGAATTGVSIVDFDYVATTVTIQVGDTVLWTDNGSAHSVTADDLSFDSSPGCPGACLTNGQTFSHTFNAAGTFVYHCRLHGAVGGLGMSGTVIVQGAGPTTTTSTSTTTTTSTSTTTSSTTTTSIPSAVDPAQVVATPITYTG